MQIIKKIASLVIIALIFYFLIMSLIKNWYKIPFAELRLDIFSLTISFVFLSGYFLILVVSWKKIVEALGESIRLDKAFWIISTSQLAKYTPGGVWYTLGRVYLGKTEKMKSEIVFLSVIIETCLLMLTALGIFLVSISFMRGSTILSPLSSILIMIVLLIVLYPPLLNRLLNRFLQIFRRPTIKFKISYARMLGFSGYFLCLWLLQIIGFCFLINSVYPIAPSKIFHVSAAYTISWLVGLIAPFAPGGLGVREGMMTLILSSIFPAPLAIAISFIQRIWITIFEIAIFFVGLLIKKRADAGKRD